MKSYPFRRRTTPKRARMAGFTEPVRSQTPEHAAVPERHFTPDAGLPTRGAATVPPTPHEGLRIFR